MNQKQIITIVIVIVIGVGAFFAGMQYQQQKLSQRVEFNGSRQRLGQNANARAVRGQIVSADSNSITVKMQDGSTRIIILSAATAINKAVSGSKDDLKIGEQVMAFGNDNSDGSVTAQNIQINPTAISR